MSVAGCLSPADFRRVAKRRLPRQVFDYVDGAAGDECSAAQNHAAFARYGLVPRVGRAAGASNSRTSLLGIQLAAPLALAPIGGVKLLHRDGELAAARCARRAGVIFTLSTVGTVPIEEIAAIAPGASVFQIYLQQDRAATAAAIERCRDAGIAALCVTVDAGRAGNRERDARNGFRMPLDFTLRTALDLAARPRWCWDLITGAPFAFPNVESRRGHSPQDPRSIADFIAAEFEPHVQWRDVEWIAERWGGPLAVKGILAEEDAVLALNAGATALYLSNHGGRQFDGAPAALDQLPQIRERVGPGPEIILDGGVRRGGDVLKALRLGADGCAIGRAYAFALAAGPGGLERYLELLQQEISRDLALLGCETLCDLGAVRVVPLASRDGYLRSEELPVGGQQIPRRMSA